MAKSTLRARLLASITVLLIVPVLLLVGEVGVRIFTDKLDPLAVFVTSPQLRADTQGESTRGLFEFDPLLTWRLKANLHEVWWDYTPVTTNALHLRLDHEVGPKRGLRVICLGDSVTFGYRVPVASDPDQPGQYDAAEKTYPQLLEAALQAKFPDREIEVLPLACPGYTSGQGLAWLRREFAALKPDIVTACFGFNDARAGALPDRETQPSETQASVRKLIASSQLMMRLVKWTQEKRAGVDHPQPEPRSSAEEYLAHFAEMAALCKGQGVWFGAILPIYRDPNTPGDYPEQKGHVGDPEEAIRIGQYRTLLDRAAREGGWQRLAIPELTEAQWPKNAPLFGERIHPNAAGHQLIAERLTDWLAPVVRARK
jgi:lysophospholipase L1-like esterase